MQPIFCCVKQHSVCFILSFNSEPNNFWKPIYNIIKYFIILLFRKIFIVLLSISYAKRITFESLIINFDKNRITFRRQIVRFGYIKGRCLQINYLSDRLQKPITRDRLRKIIKADVIISDLAIVQWNYGVGMSKLISRIKGMYYFFFGEAFTNIQLKIYIQNSFLKLKMFRRRVR